MYQDGIVAKSPLFRLRLELITSFAVAGSFYDNWNATVAPSNIVCIYLITWPENDRNLFDQWR